MKKLLAGGALLGFLLLPLTSAPGAFATTPDDPYTLLPANPSVAAQPTEAGKAIKDLRLLGRELYTGYGDYSANTGPINVTSTNVDSLAITDWLSVPTEALDTYVELNGNLYTPYIDPRVDWNKPVGYATNVSGEWELMNVTPFIHVYDVASTDGQDLWLAGSIMKDGVPGDGVAALKRSTDGGTTWTTEKTRSSVPGTGNEVDRYYWMAGLNGRLYAQASVNDNGVPAALEYWENGTWTSVPGTETMAGMVNAATQVVFANKILFPTGGTITALDTTTNTATPIVVSTSGGRISDLYTTPTAVYALATDGIWKSTDGTTWGLLTSHVPANPDLRSFAVDEEAGKVYVGAANGDIYSGPLSFTELSPPTITGLTKVSLPLWGESFDALAGVTALDPQEGDITGNILVDTTMLYEDTLGTYAVTYTVANSEGLSTTETRIVEVTLPYGLIFFGGGTLAGLILLLVVLTLLRRRRAARA